MMTGMAILLVCALGADDSGWRSNRTVPNGAGAVAPIDRAPTDRRAPTDAVAPAERSAVLPASAQSPWSSTADELVERAERAVRESVNDALNGAPDAFDTNAGRRRNDSVPPNGRGWNDGLPNDGLANEGANVGAGARRSGLPGVGATDRFTAGWDDFEAALEQPFDSLRSSGSRQPTLSQRLRAPDLNNPVPSPPGRVTESASRRTGNGRVITPDADSGRTRTGTAGTSRPVDELPTADRRRFRDWLNESDTLPVDADDLPILEDQEEWDPRGSARSTVGAGRTDDRFRLDDQDFAERSSRLRRETLERSGVPSAADPRSSAAGRRSSSDSDRRQRNPRIDDFAEERIADERTALDELPPRDYVQPPARDWSASDAPVIEPDPVMVRDRVTSDGSERRPTRRATQRVPADEDDYVEAGDTAISPSDEADRGLGPDRDDRSRQSDGTRLTNRPWGPLMLAVLGLFGSIGFNIYLGWIAWDLYTRYQDAVSDVHELEGKLEEQQLEQVAGLGSARRTSSRQTVAAN